MERISRLVAVVALVLVSATPVAAQTAAGRIDRLSGTAFVVRAGSQTAIKAGDEIFETDVLRTGADGHVGVTLKDDTRLSLGPGGEVRLERFVYAPAEGKLALGLKVVKGIVAYVSGKMAKLAPDSVRLETPAAIVGVRGTTLVIQAQE